MSARSLRKPRRITGAVFGSLLLAGCSASGNPDFGLTPPGSIGGAPGQSTLQPAPPISQSAPPEESAATTTMGAVQFLPLVGAPPETVAALSQALAESAARSGVTILPSSDAAPPLRLKGYLSAMSEGSGTVVIYVWDIVDPAGMRVSRIQGQERIDAAGGDPWSVVGKEALARIAETTFRELRQQGAARG